MSLANLTKDVLIFTDLDGTLLDHDSYRFDEASVMLDYLKTHHIPLILVTSKTKNEVIRLQKLLAIEMPFIVENGAGILIPKSGGYETIAMGKDYKTIRQAFERYAQTVPMRGFFDMRAEEIAVYTDLPLKQAADAKERLFTEPFILEDENALDRLRKLADRDGLSVVKGGRFYHLITKGQDNAAAIRYLVKYFEEVSGHAFKTVALGDSANDLSMLQSVDTPILIPHPDGSYLPCYIPHLIKAPSPGPGGWNTALKRYFHVQ
jgi:mannosyl-3-phosphoglycerate phosphatase